MLFDSDEHEDLLRPEMIRVVQSELLGCGFRSELTHTEDGIPIRKLYVSNLPPKTTRTELFGVFAHYGFIKSCWLRMSENGPNRSPCATYAFVTYSDPAHAHKALQAPSYEKRLRGRILRISPADSWHQPLEGPDGRVHWKSHGHRQNDNNSLDRNSLEQLNTELNMDHYNNGESSNSDRNENNVEANNTESEPCYNILDVLNRDCLTHILTYVPISDLIRSERVSKGWRDLILEYLQGFRTLKTSWWQHRRVTLTTAVLRRVLARVGAGLVRLHIDHRWSALNDRTAHTLGKFCPNLEELKIVGMHTKNWNPLIYGCKQLKTLSFISCYKLTDSSLVHLVKSDSCIESLFIASNAHVTGLFLTGSNPRKLKSLAFYNCYSLQGTVLSAAIDMLPNLTTLKLDVCPVTMWKMIPLILRKLPRLEELSLSEYTSVELNMTLLCIDAFIESIANLKEIKILNLSRNIYITNAVLKQVAQTCSKLQCLNVSSCNSRRNLPHTGVGDEGVSAVCRACPALSRLDVSYLAALTDAGVSAAAHCSQLTYLTARGNNALTHSPLAACIARCQHLTEIDVCGCDNVSEDLVESAVKTLETRGRVHALRLLLAGTCASFAECLPTHKLLTCDVVEDRCDPQLRPDFVDRVFDDSSDDESFDDIFDHDNFLGSDDDMYLDDDLVDDLGAIYAYHYDPDNIILL